MDLIERHGLGDAVDFVSGVSDERIVELYAEAELAVVPSLYEGFSLPAIEAMATGTALVATDGGALPEVTGRDGETVLAVPRPATPTRSPTTIRRGLDDTELRARVGDAGRRRVVERWTWRRCAELTVEQYREVLAMPENIAKARQQRASLRCSPFASIDSPRSVCRRALSSSTPAPGSAGTPSSSPGAATARSRSTSAADEVEATRATLAAMVETGEVEDEHVVGVLRGDATALPFPDATFDAVITSEVLEHIPDDVGALAELRRVVRRGGVVAVTVPSWLPEKVNWMLSDEYHAPAAAGGHVRIYSATELKAKLRAAGLDVAGYPPRPRPALAVLVAEVRRRRQRRRPSARPPLPPVPRVGHRPPTALDPRRRAGAVPSARQEPRPLRESARELPICRGAVRCRSRRDGAAPRRLQQPERDDPVVPRRSLRSVEPRRVGDGPRRRRPPRRGVRRLPLARRHAAAVRRVAQLLPRRRQRRGGQARHQRLRLHRHGGAAPLALHVVTRSTPRRCGRRSNGR